MTLLSFLDPPNRYPTLVRAGLLKDPRTAWATAAGQRDRVHRFRVEPRGFYGAGCVVPTGRDVSMHHALADLREEGG